LAWLAGSTSLGISITAALIFIPKQLWKRWRLRLVDRIDQVLRRKVSRFGRHYREFMLSSLRRIDVKGLATIGFYTPELDEVFVDVSLAYRAPHQIPEGVLTQTPADVTDRRSLKEFLDNEDPAVLAVVGVPGSGKTTLLRHTARALCRHPRGRRRTVPMLLYLRDHVTKIVANPHVPLPELIVDTLGRMGTTEPPGWFEQHVRAGRGVVLLDGLDEVAKKEDRTKVSAWVAEQTRQYPRNDFVITSRPQGYRDAPIDGAVVVQVRNFTGEQVSRLVHGWYLAIERHATNESGPDVHLRANEAAEDLLKRLDANPALHDLTVNPLLLTMIANVHRFRGALPGSRTDLYAEICQVMLSRRQEAKNLTVELSGDKKEALLRRLAFVMMQNQVRDVARADLIAELKPLLRRMSTQLTEEKFLADVSSNGLLIERESGQYSFAHLTFQEYLAAGYIRDNGLVQTLADAIYDPWWREVTLLYAARAEGDLIVKACLNSGSIPTLSLAFDIAEQDGEFAPELRGQLNEILNTASSDAERRHLRNGILVAKHLRDRIRTETGTRVCALPINFVVYGYFMEDTDNPPPDSPVTEQVTGVRATDAIAFVRWANDVTGSTPEYRLPTRAEIDDPAIQRALAATPTLSVWVDSGDPTQPELWTPTGSKHLNTIDGEILTHHLATDFARSTSTLVRLVLGRSLSSIREVGQVLAFARAPAPALTRSCARDLILARDFARNFILARDFTLERALDRAIALSWDLDSALTRELDHARDIDHARTLTRELDYTLVTARDIDRACALDHTLALDCDHSLVFDLIGNPIAMGKALSRALADTPYRSDSMIPTWLEGFIGAFVAQTRISGTTLAVQLDALANALRVGQESLLALPEATCGDWARAVVIRLEEIALPVLTRRKPVTTETATAIRIAALCLAVEADDDGQSLAGDAYRHIAAGITLMERRANGDVSATETIMLATS
jgi:hypothetical protein